jgi:hypothetical protein
MRTIFNKCPGFEPTSKRKKGFPSETRVKRGKRIVHADKELAEKLGRNDLCPCQSGRRFQEVLHDLRPLSMAPTGTSIRGNNPMGAAGPPKSSAALFPLQSPNGRLARGQAA